MDGVPADQFYTGLVADLYSPLRAEWFDPDPYARFISRFGQPALELGCGDGHPMLDLIEQGFVVEGVDASADMLDRCRAAAAARHLQVTVHQARFEDMDLGRRYASIYVAGATINLIPDDLGLAAALRRIASHLLPDGAALVPLMIPARVSLLEPLVREAINADGSLVRVTTLARRSDEGARTESTLLRYERIVEGRAVERVDREWLFHWHTKASFTALAEECGLVVRSMRDIDPGQASSVFACVLTVGEPDG